jgi:hypothetical protein
MYLFVLVYFVCASWRKTLGIQAPLPDSEILLGAVFSSVSNQLYGYMLQWVAGI